MAEIDSVMQMFADSGARALYRYAAVSGEGLDDLPEYFMPAFILNDIGDQVPATLETRFSKLSNWNNDARKRSRLPPLPEEEKARLLALAEDLGSPRVDMVLYQGDEGQPKDELGFLALVEFKKGWISPLDRTRLLRILPHIDTCRYGIVCGCTRADRLEYEIKEAYTVGDRWYQAEVRDSKVLFCARLFEISKTKSILSYP